jgi:uncharacterized protein YodC (DUF2158 family)
MTSGQEIKDGDTVVLKSGGPNMTVADIGEYGGKRGAKCDWFDGKKRLSEVFVLTSLEKTN